ncbi:hypothetical protein LTR28_001944, partial [Elasticomyces elasticus]
CGRNLVTEQDYRLDVANDHTRDFRNPIFESSFGTIRNQSGGPMGGGRTAVLAADDRLKNVAEEHPSRLKEQLLDEDCGRDRKGTLYPSRLFVPAALSEPGSEDNGWLAAVRLQRRSVRVATTAAGEGQSLQPDGCEGIRREGGMPDARRGAGAASQVASNADRFGRSMRTV